IFSFGAVLYEMATGVRAFQASSSAQTLSAVLNADPKPPTEIRADLPRDLERVIQRCLRKDPARRFQVMADLAVELEEIRTDSGTRVAPTSSPGRTNWWRIVVAAAAVLVAIAAASTWWSSRDAGGALPLADPKPLTSFAGDEQTPSLSPDGNQVAFTWNGEQRNNEDVYVMPVGGGTPIQLTTSPLPIERRSGRPAGIGSPSY